MGVQTVRRENFPQNFSRKNKQKEAPSSPPLPSQVPLPGDKKKAVQGRRLKKNETFPGKSFSGRVFTYNLLFLHMCLSNRL